MMIVADHFAAFNFVEEAPTLHFRPISERRLDCLIKRAGMVKLSLSNPHLKQFLPAPFAHLKNDPQLEFRIGNGDRVVWVTRACSWCSNPDLFEIKAD